jgi:nitric oxide reductase NorQ protein
MMTGPAGCGKTLAAKALTKGLNRPDFYFNLGATQDARATLIGNTHFDSKKGTFFAESAFVKAITTPNAVVLLDELSRAHPDAWNILMTVLDLGQRYLRLDEAVDSPIVNVAEGVTFIATANIGGEYTSTRVLDRAILDRFTTIEMDVLNDEQEFNLLKYMYPAVSEEDLKAVAEISTHTRDIARGGDGKLSTGVSTRASVETAGLLYDGFSLFEAAEISMFPFFSNDGGVDSERTYVKQLVQKYIKDEKADEALFTEPTQDDSEKIVW